jgi:hypothetical protein
MNLHKEFERALTSLGNGSAGLVEVEALPRTLYCDVLEQNSLAVSFNRLRLTTTELSGASSAELERLGKSLAEKLTYLMEPISPIELDAQGCVMQLRSSPPQRDDDGRSYYELLVRRGEISLARYRKENDRGRRPIVATVTREVLFRLADDFCAVLE